MVFVRVLIYVLFFFFFKQKTAYEMRISDWSSDVCSSDLLTERGQGVPQDSERAFQLFMKAAEAGHPDAQNAVGLAYMSGRGVERNPTEAATWFQAASGNGNPRGAYHLGRLFEPCLDGEADPAAAQGVDRIAAEARAEPARAGARKSGM